MQMLKGHSAVNKIGQYIIYVHLDSVISQAYPEVVFLSANLIYHPVVIFPITIGSRTCTYF